jgi:CBS domain-containing protein
MARAKDLLQNKGHDVWTISPGATVYEALQLMADKDIGALPVLKDGDTIVGMFSERDYARKVVLKGKSSHDTTVGELMSSPVYSIGPGETLDDCLVLMTNRRIRHIPVVDQGRLVGLVSIGDVVKAMIADQRLAIKDLENYITGGSR